MLFLLGAGLAMHCKKGPGQYSSKEFRAFTCKKKSADMFHNYAICIVFRNDACNKTLGMKTKI